MSPDFSAGSRLLNVAREHHKLLTRVSRTLSSFCKEISYLREEVLQRVRHVFALAFRFCRTEKWVRTASLCVLAVRVLAIFPIIHAYECLLKDVLTLLQDTHCNEKPG